MSKILNYAQGEIHSNKPFEVGWQRIRRLFKPVYSPNEEVKNGKTVHGVLAEPAEGHPIAMMVAAIVAVVLAGVVAFLTGVIALSSTAPYITQQPQVTVIWEVLSVGVLLVTFLVLLLLLFTFRTPIGRSVSNSSEHGIWCFKRGRGTTFPDRKQAGTTPRFAIRSCLASIRKQGADSQV